MLTPAKRITLLLLAILLLIPIALALSSLFTSPSRTQRRGPDADFAPQVYLWQRAWTDPLRQSLQAEAPSFSQIVVLAAQIDFTSNIPHTTTFHVDWPLLQSTHTPIAAAIRISTYAGPFDNPTFLTQAIQSTIAAAKAANLSLIEIQIDFDAPTSKLSGYRNWLTAARKTAAPIPLTFTALPTWLDSPAFQPLAKDAGYFVLQVHWLEHPRRLENLPPLCDLPTARCAIHKAAALNIPFRVALPTYSYLAAFNSDGSLAAVASENAPPHFAENKTVRLIQPNPEELAAFVNEFQAIRPISMRGFIWYRLPISSDRLNWSFPALQCVLAGKNPPPGKLAVAIQKSADNLYDIQLQNIGLQDIDTACQVTLTWDHADLTAVDALGDCDLGGQLPSNVILTSPSHPSPLHPGESRPIAWLRLSHETAIHAEIKP